jgi:arylsulfatase A-like enzyme
MRRRAPFWGTVAAVLLLGLLGEVLTLQADRPAAPPGRRLNIIVVSLDNLRKSSFRYGDPAVSGFGDLGRRSVVFEHALSTASWTLPAHASLLTGLYPDRHGATDRRLRLAHGLPSLARSLWREGYETVAFTDKGFLDREFGFGQGFERYDDWKLRPDPRLDAVLPRDGDALGSPEAELFDRALAFLGERRHPSRPFFLFLHTFAVHDYFLAPPWATATLPPYRDAYSDHYLDCMSRGVVCPPEEWRRLEALYEAQVTHVDQGVERLLRAVDRAGLRDSTLIVLLADHGEGFDVARGRIHHGGRLHRDLLEVPLLVSGPGLEPRSVTQPVSLVDVAPTLLDLAGAPVPPDLDGVSLAPALRGEEAPPERTIYAMEHSLYWRKGGRREVRRPHKMPLGLAAVEGSRWYIRTPKGEELYDVAADPAQARNLAAGARDANGGLKGELEDFRERVSDRGTVVPNLELVKQDEEVYQRLRALGYVR